MQIGPYRILEEIARGGMGVVYRAQSADGQQVALKLLLAQRAANPTARRRFQLEAAALGRLRHPGVVSILSAGDHQGNPWLALEFVEGQSLDERLRHGPLPVEEAIRAAQQLARALVYVHGCSLLHRDLKPANVLLRGDQVLLTDFGLVLDEQSEASRITATGVFQGTPGYWAPEQARGETAQHGERTDVYGLGAVIYACLTGVPPVQAASLQEYVQAVGLKATPPPRRVRAEVPEWLSALCMRCLAPEPASRPASAEEVARALVLADSGPPSGFTSSRKGGLALVGGAALVAVFAGLAWWGGGAQQEPSPPTEQPAETRAAAGQREQALAWIESGNAKANAGHHLEAIEDYAKAIELDPRNVRAYSNRGACKTNLRRDEEAIEDYTKAIEFDPGHSFAYTGRGVSKANLERHPEAIEDFDKAIELDPRNATAYASRGLSKGKLGRDVEAIQDYTLAIEFEPSHANAYANRGLSLAALTRYAEALEDCDKAIEFDPRNASAHSTRALSKAQLGRPSEAIGDYDKAFELDPQSASESAYRNRGLCKLQLRRYAEAIEDLDKAIEFGSNTASDYSNRGTCRMRLGRPTEAIEDFDTALELGLPRANADQVRRMRADAAAKLGK